MFKNNVITKKHLSESHQFWKLASSAVPASARTHTATKPELLTSLETNKATTRNKTSCWMNLPRSCKRFGDDTPQLSRATYSWKVSLLHLVRAATPSSVGKDDIIQWPCYVCSVFLIEKHRFNTTEHDTDRLTQLLCMYVIPVNIWMTYERIPDTSSCQSLCSSWTMKQSWNKTRRNSGIRL